MNTAATNMGGLRDFLESRRFTNFITGVILVNAVTLGLETSPTAMAATGGALQVIDTLCLAIFTLEILAKLVVYRGSFFRSGWNIFDLVIVAIALLPASGPLSVLRAMRILRVLRLLSVVPEMRRVVGSLLAAVPGMSSIAGVMLLLYYVSAVLSTKLFGERFPEWFGSIGESMYTLFQVMTLESWSMGVVRPVMEVYPWAWAFFVPFILVTTFAVVNLVIAVIVNSMQSLQESEERAAAGDAAPQPVRDADLAQDIAALRREIADLKTALDARARPGA
jgi:voltage-gated sodium channel